MKQDSNIIDRGIEGIARVVSLLILIITVIIAYEVIARYAFNAPTNWAWSINKQLFGVYVLFSGCYALIHKTHIRIEVFYQHFSSGVKRVIHWLTFTAALLFLGSLLWKSYEMAFEAWQVKEKAVGVFKLPLYPLKMLMPVGAALFILACLSVYLKRKSSQRED